MTDAELHSMIYAHNLAIKDLQARNDRLAHAVHILQERFLILDAMRMRDEMLSGEMDGRGPH